MQRFTPAVGMMVRFNRSERFRQHARGGVIVKLNLDLTVDVAVKGTAVSDGKGGTFFSDMDIRRNIHPSQMEPTDRL